MIKDYNIIQIIDSSTVEGCDNGDLTFGRVVNFNDEYCFDYEEDDEGEDIYRPAISFYSRINQLYRSLFYIRSDFVDSYNVIKVKLEYYKNGRIKKQILKGGRKVRLLSPSKARKTVKKRTRRVVRELQYRTRW